MMSLCRPERRALYACYAAMMCLAMALNFLPVFLTTFSHTFGAASGLTTEQLGRIPAVMFLSFIVAILITGPLADRVRIALIIRFALGTTLVGLGWVAMAPSYSCRHGVWCRDAGHDTQPHRRRVATGTAQRGDELAARVFLYWGCSGCADCQRCAAMGHFVANGCADSDGCSPGYTALVLGLNLTPFD